MSKSKRYLENFEQVTNDKSYILDDAVNLLSSLSKTKFDETVDLSINLGVDPRHADQIVRGTVSLPHGTGKQLKVLVIAKGDKVTEAMTAGADFAGDKEYLDKIKSGWVDIDIIISNHAIYIPQGVICEVTKKYKKKIVSYVTGYRKNSWIFSHGDTYHYTMMTEPVSDWENIDLNEKKENKTFSFKLHSSKNISCIG